MLLLCKTLFSHRLRRIYGEKSQCCRNREVCLAVYASVRRTWEDLRTILWSSARPVANSCGIMTLPLLVAPRPKVKPKVQFAELRRARLLHWCIVVFLTSGGVTRCSAADNGVMFTTPQPTEARLARNVTDIGWSCDTLWHRNRRSLLPHPPRPSPILVPFEGP